MNDAWQDSLFQTSRTTIVCRVCVSIDDNQTKQRDDEAVQ